MRNIASVYSDLCLTYNRAPNDAASRSWEDVLGEFPLNEILAAVAEHKRDSRPDDRGVIRGAWMPQPADIKRILEERRNRERALGTRKRRWCGRNGCIEGWVYVSQNVVRACECRSAPGKAE